jgi:hypothetical protein
MRVANCVHGSSAFAITPHAFLFFDPGGRPGPRRRLRRRRPFFAGFAVEKFPSNACIAERTSCCTRSRITVNKLLCLDIESSFPAGRYTSTRSPAKAVRQASQLQEKHAGGLLTAEKLLDMAQTRSRRLDGTHLLPLVQARIVFVDGVQHEGRASRTRARLRDHGATPQPFRFLPAVRILRRQATPFRLNEETATVSASLPRTRAFTDFTATTRSRVSAFLMKVDSGVRRGKGRSSEANVHIHRPALTVRWNELLANHGTSPLMTSSPFIESVVMSFASRFIFSRSTIRIWLFS